jgi:polyferredoxin
MYKFLRYARIVISIVATLLITLAVLNVGGITQTAGTWLAQAQIGQAILVLSAVWIVFWTAATLFFGRIYCSTVCPLGTLQDVIAALSLKCSGKKAYHFRAPKTYLRVIALLVFVEGTSLGLSFITEYIDPYNCYEHLVKVFIGASAAGWLTAAITFAVVAAMSWRKGRLLCNTICPVGAALGAISHVSMMHFDINPDLCTHCGKCEDVCKGECIKQTVSIVDNSRCVSCFNCVSVCPCNAITYRSGRHRLQWPLMQRIATSSTLANVEQSTSTTSNLTNQQNTSNDETIS